AVDFEQQLVAVLLDYLGAQQRGAGMLLGERRAHGGRHRRFRDLVFVGNQLAALCDVDRGGAVLALDRHLIWGYAVLGLLVDLGAGQIAQHLFAVAKTGAGQPSCLSWPWMPCLVMPTPAARPSAMNTTFVSTACMSVCPLVKETAISDSPDGVHTCRT